MAKALDFNSVRRPTLLLTMKDDAHTKIRVSAPKEYLVEELQDASAELDEVLRRGDQDSIDATFDLAARLISCNTSGIRVTPDDLRGKYGLELDDLIIFYSAYIDFITEIGNSKN